MNAIPPDFHSSALALIDNDARLAARWAALAEAARVVAQLADVGDGVDRAMRLPVALDRLVGGRRVLIEQGIDDLLAMMEPGLTALLDVHQGGGATGPAARALWQEFLRARQGLAALAPLGAPLGRPSQNP